MGLIEALLRSDAFPHSSERISVRETHISWVVLTGEWAYKIKKPVRLPFLDFSTLALRKAACQDELALNQRFSPELYESVVAIRHDAEGYRIVDEHSTGEGDGSDERIVDYAVRMREFPADALLLRMLQDGRLTVEHLEQVAEELARVHKEAPVALDSSPWGRGSRIVREAADNCVSLEPILAEALPIPLARVGEWTRHQAQGLESHFERRRATGFVRECHGDLHLGNVIWWQGRVRLFDCVEFNPSFRWIDTFSDLAFLLMDLEEHHQHAGSSQLLNRYLEVTGDYEGLRGLTWYKVYRAMVRAKIAALRWQQRHASSHAPSATGLDEIEQYLNYARHLTQRPSPALVVTCGLSGSGKSTGTIPLLETGKAIRIRSDVERKRLAQLPRDANTGSALGGGIYNEASTRATYQRLAALAKTILDAGYWCIVDAACLTHWQRQELTGVAETSGVDCHLLEFAAPMDDLRKRIKLRSEQAQDPSEAASRDLLEYQKAQWEPLTHDELARKTTVAQLLPLLT